MAKRTPPASIDDHIAKAAPEARPVLERIRRIVRRAVPEAEETIGYQMPAFRLARIFVYFAAFQRHIGIFPPVEGDAALRRALAPYQGEKGNLRFPLDQPIPYELIRRVVTALAREQGGGAKPATRKRGATATRKAAGKAHVVHHRDGSVWAKGRLAGKVMVGYWEWFRKDGTRMRSGTFENGEQVGEWTTYDRAGKVVKVTTMKRKPR